MKLVKQEEIKNACGAACVAMLLNITINEAIVLVDSERTHAADLRKTLKKYKVILGRKVLTEDWNAVKLKKNLSLLAVNTRTDKKGDLCWHWVIYDNREGRNLIFDPMATKVRTSRNSTKLAWYHNINIQ